METYKFTRVLFGLAPLPSLLGGVLEYHLDSWAQRYPEDAEWLRRSFYIDNLFDGGQDVQHTKAQKEVAQAITSDATFKLHKWHSNCPELEEDGHQQETEVQSIQLKSVKRAPILPQKPKNSHTPSNSCKSSQVNRNY